MFFRTRNRRHHYGRVIDHHDEHQDGGEQCEAFEEDRQRIGRVETPEPGRLVLSRAWPEKPGADQDCDERADCSEGQNSLVDALSKRFQHQNHHA